jgi:Flp pilus assembly protein TadD
MNGSFWLRRHRIGILLLAGAVIIGLIGWVCWGRRPPPQSEMEAASIVGSHGDLPPFGGEDISRRPLASIADDEYVGSHECAACHAGICESFGRHPMRQSLAAVEDARPVEDYQLGPFAPPGPWRYRAEKLGQSVWHHEQMLARPGEGAGSGAGHILYDQAVEVSHALGSGTRGRSYLIDRDGQFFVSSINWYSGSHRWDLAPGYPPENHLRFERLVREDCLFCHGGRTSPAQPDASRYAIPPFHETAIGCERCHGPGRQHVVEQRAGNARGAAAASILNPGTLDPLRRDSVCHQCHLHGEIRIPRHNRQLADFRPGQRLDEMLSVLVQPAPPTEDGALRAISQVEQLRISACFQKGGGDLGCISCHDPHAVPDAAERRDYFNHKCLTCHATQGCALAEEARAAAPAHGSCVDCHMPRSAAGGIPHTAQTDHRIRRRPVALASAPRVLDLASLEFFDGGDPGLPDWERSRARGIMLLELGSRRSDRVRIAADAERLLRQALGHAPDDIDALHALGTACLRQSRQREALECWNRVLEQRPDRLETLQAHAVLCHAIGEFEKATRSLERLLRLSPGQAEYFHLYGQLQAEAGNWDRARLVAAQAVAIDPSRPEYRELLAVALARLGRESESRRQFEIIQKITAATSH